MFQLLFVFAGCFKSNPKMNDRFNSLTPKPGSYSSKVNAQSDWELSDFHGKKNIFFNVLYPFINSGVFK